MAERVYDVVVIGGGITGLSVLWHLRGLGLQNMALSCPGTIEPAAPPPVSASAAGMISGGQIDNYCRVSHAHGRHFAAELWRFGDLAFDSLVAHCRARGVAHGIGPRRRLITSAFELKEAEESLAQMQADGCGSAALLDVGGPMTHAHGPAVQGVQDEGSRGGWVAVGPLLADLAAAAADLPCLDRVASISPGVGGGMLLTDRLGTKIRCELVVVAAHLQIGTLVPELRTALVSVADQWHGTTLPPLQRRTEWDGVAFTANNAHEWGVFPAPDRLLIGGGRFIRPMAGFEAAAAAIDPAVTAYLQSRIKGLFGLSVPKSNQIAASGGAPLLLGEGTAGLDIRPCDELPIIGPMFGNGRLLVATGYMQSGLTQGFLAGRCLAELIARGRCDILPRRLWPERLRTMD